LTCNDILLELVVSAKNKLISSTKVSSNYFNTKRCGMQARAGRRLTLACPALISPYSQISTVVVIHVLNQNIYHASFNKIRAVARKSHATLLDK